MKKRHTEFGSARLHDELELGVERVDSLLLRPAVEGRKKQQKREYVREWEGKERHIKGNRDEQISFLEPW